MKESLIIGSSPTLDVISTPEQRAPVNLMLALLSAR
jgi:hypothetical protein